MKKMMILLSLLFLTLLLGCKEEKSILSITIDRSNFQETYELGLVDITSFSLIVEYDDESTEIVPLSESMINSTDLAKLSTIGIHHLSVIYQNMNTILDIQIVKPMILSEHIAQILWRIYHFGLVIAPNASSLSYETWLDNLSSDAELPLELNTPLDFRLTVNQVQWKYEDEDTWHPLIEIYTLARLNNYSNTSMYEEYLLLYPNYEKNEYEWMEELLLGTLPISSALTTAYYPEGIDLSLLSGDSKAIIYAALENYLLENMYAGVPLYQKGTPIMHSSRLSLFSEFYNGYFGYGEAFSSFTLDDSHVLFEGGVYGNANEYTFRDVYTYDPTTLNPWTADDSSTSKIINFFSGSLYSFTYDESLTGFQVVPSLAKSLPIPINPVIVNGEIVATKWQIEIKDNLTWSFHQDTDVSTLPSGYTELDATDFLWTYEYALTNDWFRAVSGGNDFISQGILNAKEFHDGNVSFDEVGLRLSSEKANTLEFEFENNVSSFDISYQFSYSALSPINEELFLSLGEDYGTSPTTVASSGVYLLEQWDQEHLIYFTQNQAHPDASLYHYTGYLFQYMFDDEAIFEAFIDGYLDITNVPAVYAPSYLSDERLRMIPSSTVWQLTINGFGTTQNQQEYALLYPDLEISTSFTPEPILSYLEMREALYYGIDRSSFGEYYLPTSVLFAPNMFIDATSGTSLRSNEASSLITDNYEDVYDLASALSLFKEAVAEAINDGYYQPGTSTNYTEIHLSFTYASSGNESIQALVENLKTQIETRFIDDENYVKIIIDVIDVAFPSNYYDYITIANTDLGLGGIATMYYDFLDSYCDDARNALQMNFGIDTHTANIEIAYTDIGGILRQEIWSFNALASALYGKVYVEDGILQTTNFISKDIIIENFMTNTSQTIVFMADGANYGETLYGETLSEKAVAEGIERLVVDYIVTDQDTKYLFVVSFVESRYQLYDYFQIYDTPTEAIENESWMPLESEPTFITTDNGITENSYLAENYEFTSLALLYEYTGANQDIALIVACDYGTSADVVVLYKIDDFYIVWYWL